MLRGAAPTNFFVPVTRTPSTSTLPGLHPEPAGHAGGSAGPAARNQEEKPEEHPCSLPPGAPGSPTSLTPQPSPCSKTAPAAPPAPKALWGDAQSRLACPPYLGSRCCVKSRNALPRGWKLRQRVLPRSLLLLPSYGRKTRKMRYLF